MASVLNFNFPEVFQQLRGYSRVCIRLGPFTHTQLTYHSIADSN